MANPSYTYSLTNGTTADASQVMQNFNDILNGVTDGTKDISISALTVAGTATLNGNVNVGNASGDDLTITGSLASSIPIKTTNSYDIGSATLGLRKIYLGNAGGSTTQNIVGPASVAGSATYIVPDVGTTGNFLIAPAGSSGQVLRSVGTAVPEWIFIGNAQIRADTGNGFGSGSTMIRRFTNFVTTGTGITSADSSTLGSTFTINEAGIYAIAYSDLRAAAPFTIGISQNSNQLTTSVGSITIAHRIAIADQALGLIAACAVTVRCAVNDVIRAHTDGNESSTAAFVQFTITQVARI